MKHGKVGMHLWHVEIHLWPGGTERFFPIVADSGPDAIRKALDLLKLKPGLLLHTIYAHIGAPHAPDKRYKSPGPPT